MPRDSNQAIPFSHSNPWENCWVSRTLQVAASPDAKHGFRCVNDTVDGRNPAPVDMDNIPFFIGFYRYKVVIAGFLSHQQYCSSNFQNFFPKFRGWTSTIWNKTITCSKSTYAYLRFLIMGLLYNLFRWLAQFSSINNHLILNLTADWVGLAILGGWNPYQTTKFAEEANLWTIICHCHGPGITHHRVRSWKCSTNRAGTI